MSHHTFHSLHITFATVTFLLTFRQVELRDSITNTLLSPPDIYAFVHTISSSITIFLLLIFIIII